MSPKHTPGPWIIKRTRYGFPTIKHYGKTVSTFPYQGIDRNRDQVEANACLIATAPEMIDALKVITLDPKIMAWLEANDPNALKQARAAVHKAEGVTQ